jgi:hypothetical protein
MQTIDMNRLTSSIITTSINNLPYSFLVWCTFQQLYQRQRQAATYPTQVIYIEVQCFSKQSSLRYQFQTVKFNVQDVLNTRTTMIAHIMNTVMWYAMLYESDVSHTLYKTSKLEYT